MTRRMKHFLALLLVLTMCAALFPISALAEDEGSGTIELVEEDELTAEETEPAAEPEVLPPVANELEESYAGDCGDDLIWLLEDGVLTFIGTGDMYDWPSQGDVPWYEYRSLITSVILPSGLTKLSDNLFYECVNLTSVEIPEGVTSIGNHVFYGCSSLSSVSIPKGVTSIGVSAFFSCSSLTSVTIPEGVTSLGYCVFADCSGLTSLTIPGSVTSMDERGFDGCTQLKTAGPSGGNYDIQYGWTKSIPDNAFQNSELSSITFPAGLTSIGEKAFMYCFYLTNAEIPASVTSIGQSAFYSCRRLTSLTIPVGMTVINDYSFLGCSELTSVTIPESVTSLGTSAFCECSGLTSVTLPIGLQSIEDYAFCDCSSLSEVNYGGYKEAVDRLKGNNWSTDDNDALFNALWHYGKTLEEGWDLCGNDLIWKFDGDTSTLTIRGSGLMWDFEYNAPWNSFTNKLIAVNFESDLSSIGSFAFYSCRQLGAIEIPESVASVGDFAFSNCRGLISAEIPESVTTLGSYLFYNCVNMESIVFLGGAPDFGYNCFSNVTATAYYPADDDTWTEEIRQDYDGKITWIPCLDGKPVNPFGDVKEGKYYYFPVLWAYYGGITNGTSDTTFSPKDTCTRGQVVTFLWNAFGKPEPSSTENPFVDVKAGKYYTKAVLWAVENGITNGIDATHFDPSGPCTRGQVVTFLWKAYGKPAPSSTENPFVDVKEGKYYTQAVLWAVENGITNGVDATHFDPGTTCTRGQVVTFLYNAMG